MNTPDVTPKLLALIAGVIVVLVAALGWLVLVSPQRSKADSLDGQIAQARTSLAIAQAGKPSAKAAKAKTASLKMLAVALPASVKVPSLIRQVQHLASESGVSLDSFTPTASIPLSGYDAIPIDITVTGRFSAIQQFLRQLRMQAGVANSGRVHAKGRLFGVETLGLTSSSQAASPTATLEPSLSAMIRVDAFVFNGGAPTTATTTTTTATTSDAASATGATP